MLTKLMPIAVLKAEDSRICLVKMKVSSKMLLKIPQIIAIDITIKGAVAGE